MLIRILSTVVLALVSPLAGQDPFARPRVPADERALLSAELGDELDRVIAAMGDSDVAVRRAAGSAFRRLPRATQAQSLRAALWSDDRDVAFGAAVAVDPGWLDADEAARAESVLAPRMNEPGTAVDIVAFVELLDADDVSRLLADPAPLPREHSQYLGRLHRAMRPEHIPSLAGLTLSDDALVREGALNSMRVVAELTHRNRENVAAALLSWPGGVPRRFRFDPARDRDPVQPKAFTLPEPTGGFSPTLALVLRRLFVTPVDRALEQYESWAVRWANSERSATGDLPLLEALGSRAPVARAVAARAAADLGARELLGRLATDEDPVVHALARCGLARVGDAGALHDLADAALEDPLGLAAFLEADPESAIAALAEPLVADDVDAAAALVSHVARAAALVPEVPFRWSVDPGAALAARAVAAGVAPRVLAALAEALPGARSRELADAWIARLDAASLRSPAVDLLEVADRAGLVARLRELAGREEPVALDLLLALGDPASDRILVGHVRRVEQGDIESIHASDVPTFIRLARSASPGVTAFLLDVVESEPRSYRAFAALAALEACRGVDERLARSLLEDLYSYEERVRDEWERLAAAARDGGGALVVAWLERRPLDAGTFGGLGALDAEPARVWLRRAAAEREHGLFWWAVGELARAGDERARLEVRGAIERGWQARLEVADPLALAGGVDPRAGPVWVEELATNCCAAETARRVLDALVGERLGGRLDATRAGVPAEWARRFFAEFGSRLRPSRVTGHLVVGPER